MPSEEAKYKYKRVIEAKNKNERTKINGNQFSKLDFLKRKYENLHSKRLLMDEELKNIIIMVQRLNRLKNTGLGKQSKDQVIKRLQAEFMVASPDKKSKS